MQISFYLFSCENNENPDDLKTESIDPKKELASPTNLNNPVNNSSNNSKIRDLGNNQNPEQGNQVSNTKDLKQNLEKNQNNDLKPIDSKFQQTKDGFNIGLKCNDCHKNDCPLKGKLFVTE